MSALKIRNRIDITEIDKRLLEQPSGREMADVAVKAGAIDLALGVLHCGPPKAFLKSLQKQAGERRASIYASPGGIEVYREALKDSLKKERKDLRTAQIMATSGATGGLVAALRAKCKPLDRVAIIEPFYPAHNWAIQSLGLIPQYLPINPEPGLDWEAIGRMLPEVKAFLLTNPSNPTGMVVSAEDQLKLLWMCRRNNVLLIVDEVYKDFIWEGKHTSLLEISDNFDNLVALRSFSKNLAIAGWRLGFAVASEEFIKATIRVHDAIYVGAPAAIQYVMADLLTENRGEMREFIQSIVRQYRKNRRMVGQAFKSFGMEPHMGNGAFYFLAKHNRKSDGDATQELLKLGIAVAPGAAFYRPGTMDSGYIRVHFALSERNVVRVAQLLRG